MIRYFGVDFISHDTLSEPPNFYICLYNKRNLTVIYTVYLYEDRHSIIIDTMIDPYGDIDGYTIDVFDNHCPIKINVDSKLHNLLIEIGKLYDKKYDRELFNNYAAILLKMMEKISNNLENTIKSAMDLDIVCTKSAAK